MVPALRLALRIFDRQPPFKPSQDLLVQQLWKGGATDLSTRSMVQDPPRWLLLADHEHDRPPPEIDGSLLSWNSRQIHPGRGLCPTDAGGLILVSMDIDPEREAEFNDWYNTEHIPRLNSIPGVLAARRFRSLQGSHLGAPAYIALYHVEDTDIYATRTWVSANETPWMLRMRRFQRNRTYLMFRSRIA